MVTESRVERRMRETRERILAAALELFAAKGVEGTTVAEIADAADIGKGTFFRYFATKEAVFNELGRMLLARMVEGAGALAEDGLPAPELLRRFFLPAYRWHQENPRLSRLVMFSMIGSAAVMDAEQSNLQGFVVALAEVVRRGQAKGEVTTEVRAEDVALVLLGTYFTVLHAWHGGGATGSLEALAEGALAVTLRGIRP